MAELDATLKALKAELAKELAKLQSDTAAPSSFVEEGAPDSFADIDAKLKALEEKTKAELAKLQSDTAAPSSLLEQASNSGGDIFSDLDKVEGRVKGLQDKVKSEAQKFDEGLKAATLTPADPSSLLETERPHGKKSHRLLNKDSQYDKAHAPFLKAADDIRHGVDQDNTKLSRATAELESLGTTGIATPGPGSLLEEGAHIFADLQKTASAATKMDGIQNLPPTKARQIFQDLKKTIQQETADFVKKVHTLGAHPSSLLEEGAHFDPSAWAAREADLASTIKEKEDDLQDMASKFKDNARREEEFVSEFKKKDKGLLNTNDDKKAITDDDKSDDKDDKSSDDSDSAPASLLEAVEQAVGPKTLASLIDEVHASTDAHEAEMKARTAALENPYNSRLGLAELQQERTAEAAANRVFSSLDSDNLRKH